MHGPSARPSRQSTHCNPDSTSSSLPPAPCPLLLRPPQGEIFLERSDVNFHADILTSPEFFWDEGSAHQDVYEACVTFLEVPKRVDLLNMRLDVLQELFDMLNRHLDSSHMAKLNEVVIILLIMSSVLIVFYDVLLKDIGGFMRKPLLKVS